MVQVAGQMAIDIRDSFTGGAVDAYIPQGENIYCYDVNSLYPLQLLQKWQADTSKSERFLLIVTFSSNEKVETKGFIFLVNEF